MQQWEYKVCQITYDSGAGLESALNQLGADGWEIVHLETIETSSLAVGVVHCVFKRPVALGLPPFLVPKSASEENAEARTEQLAELLKRAESVQWPDFSEGFSSLGEQT